MKRNYYSKPEHPKKLFCYCSGRPKISYTSREHALSDRNKSHKRTLELRAYLCPTRGSMLWHLTSQQRKA